MEGPAPCDAGPTRPAIRSNLPMRLSAQALGSAGFVPPMMALGARQLPAAPEDWHSEIKFDGVRAIAVVEGGKARLWSRNRKALDYPEIARRLESLRCSAAVLDGEIVALEADGRSSFQALQRRELGASLPIVLFLFDLLYLDGQTLMRQPIERRRQALRALAGRASGIVQLSPWFEAGPEALLAEARRRRLEGIVLKRRGSVYEPDRRSGAWLKLKLLNEQEFVIGGFTPPKSSRQYFGAILVGHYRGGKLLYAGKVGTGFDVPALRALHARFMAVAARRCPFAGLPLGRRPRFGAAF